MVTMTTEALSTLQPPVVTRPPLLLLPFLAGVKERLRKPKLCELNSVLQHCVSVCVCAQDDYIAYACIYVYVITLWFYHVRHCYSMIVYKYVLDIWQSLIVLLS